MFQVGPTQGHIYTVDETGAQILAGSESPAKAGTGSGGARFHFHFIPTSSSWLNLVERWFRELTQKRIRRGVFRSVPELEAAIHEYLEASNQAPKPFVWTAPAQDILAKVERAAKTHAIVQNR